MPVLANCWLLITVFVIPPRNSHRWHLLSVFFNPLWLVSCQSFLWLKAAGKWVYMIVVAPFKAAEKLIFMIVNIDFEPAGKLVHMTVITCFNYASLLFEFIAKRVMIQVTPDEFKEPEDFLDEEEDDYICNLIRGIEWCNIFEALPLDYGNMQDHVHEMNEMLHTKEDRPTNEPVLPESVQLPVEYTTRTEENVQIADSAVTCNLQMDAVARTDVAYPFTELEVQEEREANGLYREYNESMERSAHRNFEIVSEVSELLTIADDCDLHVGRLGVQEDREIDVFYQEYKEKMEQFDVLNLERVQELKTILARILGDSGFPLRFSSVISDLSESSEGRTAFTRKALRGIAAGFETYYVGQCCLSWDALEYQYMKVQQMVESYDPSLRSTYDKFADVFKFFDTRLGRFMEDERAGGERFWNYAQGRLASTSLLMVPSLSDDKDQEIFRGSYGTVHPSKLLKIVEDAIHTFWIFLTKDKKRYALQERKWLLWEVSQVEDANDIELLSLIQQIHREKKTLALNLQREESPWLLKRKRRHKMKEPDSVQFLFCMIDLKLVSRVLNMASISTQQLNWCKDKLMNMHPDGDRTEIRADNLLPSP